MAGIEPFDMEVELSVGISGCGQWSHWAIRQLSNVNFHQALQEKWSITLLSTEKMSNKELKESHLVVVRWAPKTINKEEVRTFVEAKTRLKVTVHFGRKENIALIQFAEKDKQNIAFLKETWKDPDVWTIEDIYGIPSTRTVLVSKIPKTGARRRDIYMFYSNKLNTNKILFDPRIEERDFCAAEGWCLMKFNTSEDVKKICENYTKFEQFRGQKLEITRYYEPLEDLLNQTIRIDNEVIIGDIDKLKFEFMKDIQNESIEDVFQGLNADVMWSRDAPKVMLRFSSLQSPKQSLDINWAGKVKQKFQEIISKIKIEIRKFEASTWEKACEVVKNFDGFLTDEDSSTFVLKIVGYESETLTDFLKKLDDIKPPPKQITKVREVRESHKLAAFHIFRLGKRIETRFDIQCEIDASLQQLTMKGAENAINSADEEITRILLKIHVERHSIENKDHEAILNTDIMKKEIEVLMKGHDYCFVAVEKGRLVIVSLGTDTGRTIFKDVMDLIKEVEIKIEGSVESRDKVEKAAKEIEKEYQPLLKLSTIFDNKSLKLKYICPNDYVATIEEAIKSKIAVCLVKEDEILASPAYVKHLVECGYKSEIEKKMKSQKLSTNCLIWDKKEGKMTVFGNSDTRMQVKQIVNTFIRLINISWTRIEEEGIDVYFNQGQVEGIKHVEEIQLKNECSIRIATKNEMKEKDIHCITLMETGQAIFAGTSDLSNLFLPIDVVVNATNENLDNRSGLARKLVKAGGKVIQAECSAFVKSNGKLQVSDVFIGKAGKLSCLRLAHVVVPRWRGGDSNEAEVLSNVIINVLESVSKEKDSALKSIAFPLISANVSQRREAAKIIMGTLKKQLKDYESLREIFFFDTDPAVVRTIQDQMEVVFGERCYHLPVENIRVGKGTTTKFPGKHQERTGERTIPLPGQKKVQVVWGHIESTNAEVIVNPTNTSPMPSGNISNVLHNAAGVVFDLKKQCQDAFKKKASNGNVKDGTVIVTSSGNLPCSQIFHIKIGAWDDNTGEQNVRDYIKGCLQEAMRGKYKSLAFPTIGTYDLHYDANKVTRAFLRTVGDFMKLHINCSIEVIKLVIHSTDIVGTSVVETVVENMYSKRPHRLEAVIEDTTSEERDGDTHKIGHGINDFAKSTESTGKYKINSFVNLELLVGYIEKSKDDVIVCTTSSFPTLNGAIAVAIKNEGGPQIEASCKNLYKSYPDNSIASAPGSKLACRKVYFLKLDDYKKPVHGQKIYVYVKSCLEKADSEGFGSIAFPTIGTGGFKYPDITAADKTFEAIKDFFKKPKSSITSVRIVLYPQANSTIQTFNTEAANKFTRNQMPQQQSTQADNHATKSSGSSNDIWTVPSAKTKVQICYGNLEKSEADVILNTTTGFPNLVGVISSSLIRVAGPELQKECANYPNKVTEGEIVQTKGYNLQCKNVLHFVLPVWRHSQKEKMIKDKVNDCLHLMKNSKHRSIALPSIGTGGYMYDASCVARGIFEAARRFGEQCPDYECNVKVVLYPLAKDVNKIFTDILDQLKSNTKPKKGVRFTNHADQEDFGKTSIEPRKKKDFVLFQIVSDSQEKEISAFSDIKRKIEEEKKSVSIELKTDKTYDDTEILARKDSQKLILDIGVGYTTKVEIDIKNKKIHLKGIGENVKKCHDKILDEMRELRASESQKKVGHVVYKYLEWCYTEDDGRIWVPYPRQIAYMLEDAYKQNMNEVTFKDTDNKSYVVNFKKMVENIKDSKDKATAVHVVRKDLAVGDIEALPLTWEPMGATENLKEVALKTTDQDYSDVESKFRATIAPFPLAGIVQIKRIQNQALYQQYVTKKKQLESELKGQPDIERVLWHGIKLDTEAYITSNGFNRGYAGQTFAGNLWYGQGTYFAVNSEYSARNDYSPVGADGNKRMYMVKVLTGKTIAVPQGYSDRFAPLVPGSDIIRYNSVCDDDNNPEEFVIFSDTQAYPEYMIYFN